MDLSRSKFGGLYKPETLRRISEIKSREQSNLHLSIEASRTKFMQNMNLFSKDLISPAEPPTASSGKTSKFNLDLNANPNYMCATARLPQNDNLPLPNHQSPSPHT